jgi:D-alanyl-D-alanine carboxypeptidase
MNRTVLLDDLKVPVPERTTGYRKSDSLWQKTVLDVPAYGDGNIFSNLADLNHWCQAIEKRSLIRPATWGQAFSAGKLDDGTATDYGFGWFIRSKNEKPFWFHTGVWNGTRTFLGHWPDDRLSIVMLCNTEQIDPKQLSERLADQIMKPTSD